MRDHLVIPDVHTHPKVNNNRLKWLGRFIRERQPEVIVNIGDWADLDSLSSHDRGTGSSWNKFYRRDIEHANDALEILHDEINKSARYKPKLVFTAGNHEARIDRFVHENPQLEGAISMRDLKFSEFGWKVFPYTVPTEIDGVVYSHIIASGLMGRPVSGENSASKLVKTTHMSTTVGHSHLRDFAELTRGDGRKLCGLVAGCLVPPEWQPRYAGTMPRRMWWSGVVLCKGVRHGQYDPEFVSLDELRRAAKS